VYPIEIKIVKKVMIKKVILKKIENPSALNIPSNPIRPDPISGNIKKKETTTPMMLKIPRYAFFSDLGKNVSTRRTKNPKAAITISGAIS